MYHCNDATCQNLSGMTGFLKSIAEPNRLRILCVLSHEKKLSVSKIVQAVDLPQNLVSHHLKALRDRDILVPTKQGLNVFYSINRTKVDEYQNNFVEFLAEK